MPTTGHKSSSVSTVHFRTLGEQIYQLDTSGATDWPKVAIINLSDEQCISINRQLDHLAPLASLGPIGTVQKNTFKISEVVEILLKSIKNGCFPVIIGGSPKYYEHYIKVMSKFKRAYISCYFSARTDLHRDEAFSSTPFLDKINIIGAQRHMGTQTHLVSDCQCEVLWLHEIQKNSSKLEIALRESDLLLWHHDIMKATELQGLSPTIPCGISMERAMALMKQTGTSERMKFVAFGMDPDEVLTNLNASIFAQMIWYLLEGLALRRQETKFERMRRYVIHSPIAKTDVVFYKSDISSKWWMQDNHSKSDKGKLPPAYIPCSYEDYRRVTDNDIPDRLLPYLY